MCRTWLVPVGDLAPRLPPAQGRRCVLRVQEGIRGRTTGAMGSRGGHSSMATWNGSGRVSSSRPQRPHDGQPERSTPRCAGHRAPATRGRSRVGGPGLRVGPDPMPLPARRRLSASITSRIVRGCQPMYLDGSISLDRRRRRNYVARRGSGVLPRSLQRGSNSLRSGGGTQLSQSRRLRNGAKIYTNSDPESSP